MCLRNPTVILRGYESIKVLLSTTTLFLLTDAPFGLLFVGLMWLIAGPYMAAIPVLFFLLVLGVNAYFQKSMQAAASRTTTAENRKIGLLVETIEAAETIKASAGGWRMLSRWISLNDTARTYQFAMKHISERSQHFLGFAQQMAYVAQIGVGAYEVTQGSYTVGGLIACSILSGRALAPAAMLPSLLMQWAQAKASLQGLERFWDLPDDHSGVTRPLMPDTILGDFKFEDARITYPGIPMVVFILIGSRVISMVFQGVDGARWVENMLSNLPGGQVGFLIVVNIFIFFLAFFLDFFEIAFIILPMLGPVADKMGIDMVWFGVLLCVNMQTSFMHPPFGFALFYLRGIADTLFKDGRLEKPIKSNDIYMGAIPWVIMQVLLVVIVIFVPQSVTMFLEKTEKVDLDKVVIEMPVEQDATTPADSQKEVDDLFKKK